MLVVAPIRVELHRTPTIDLPVSAGFRSLSDKPCSSSLGFTASMQHSGQDNTIVSANKSIRFPISPVLLAYLFPQAAASDSIGHPIMDVQSIMSTQCQVASRLQNPAGISKTQNWLTWGGFNRVYVKTSDSAVGIDPSGGIWGHMSTAPLGQAPQARWKQTRSQISSSRYSHLQNVMDLRISQLVVAPIRVELHCTPTIDLPVSAVRFTHNTVDGHPVFLHDENAQSKKTSLWTFHIRPCMWKRWTSTW